MNAQEPRVLPTPTPPCPESYTPPAPQPFEESHYYIPNSMILWKGLAGSHGAQGGKHTEGRRPQFTNHVRPPSPNTSAAARAKNANRLTNTCTLTAHESSRAHGRFTAHARARLGSQLDSTGVARAHLPPLAPFHPQTPATPKRNQHQQ